MEKYIFVSFWGIKRTKKILSLLPVTSFACLVSGEDLWCLLSCWKGFLTEPKKMMS